jgi:hexosaminidase
VAADSAWAVTARLDTMSGAVRTTLTTQAGLPIRYTLDGTPPTTSAQLYVGPLTLAPGQRLRAATFLAGRALPGGYDAQVTTAAALTRTSRELTLCSDAVALDLEDDYPATGPRARFLLDIFNPCWRWDAAPVAQARRIAVTVGQLPFNFQVGEDRAKVRFKPPTTPAGEFEVRRGCDGERIAVLPLAPATRRPGTTRLVATLPRLPATADLCLTYTAKGVDPLWALDRVELLP